jgi:hypothetical protein
LRPCSTPKRRETLSEIKADLAQHDLRFVGLKSTPGCGGNTRRKFPADKAVTDLDRWHEFEADNPLTFVGMYQFWAQKD